MAIPQQEAAVAKHIGQLKFDCVLCSEVYKSPRLLPCSHTYCLKCLERLGADLKPGQSMTCPLCLVEFAVPEGGLPALPGNVYIETILTIQRRARKSAAAAATSANSAATVDGGRRSCTSVVQSSKHHDDWPTPAPSAAERGPTASLTGHLHDSTQSLHDPGELHRKRARKAHRSTTPAGASSSTAVDPQATSTTSAHSDDDDDDDQVAACDADWTSPSPRKSAASEHCSGPHTAGGRRPLAVYCRDCDEPMCEACFIRLHNGHRHSEVDDVAAELRDVLRRDADKLASVAVDHADRLSAMQDCKSHVLENFKSVERQLSDEAERIKTEVERDADELRQALTIDKARQAKHIDTAADTLREHITRLQTTRTRCQEMVDGGTAGELLRSFKSLHSAVVSLESSHLSSSSVVDWVASVSPDSTFVASDYRRLLPRDRVNLVGTLSVGTGAAEEAGGNLLSASAWDELKDRLEQAEREKTELEWKAATEAKQLRCKLMDSERRRRELKRQLKRVMPVSTLVHNLKISLSNVAVRGVALLSDELYVLRVSGKSADVAVYETRSFTLERRLTVPGLRAACDLAACERSGRLFVANRCTDVIHTLGRDGESSQWPVGDKPRSIAVTGDGHLLVTCFVGRQLRLFTDAGLLVRDIDLPDDVRCPWHAVQLPGQDQFIVFHASTTDAGYQLSVIDAQCGRTTKTHVEASWTTDVGQADCLVHVNVDADGFVYVLDGHNCCVQLYDTDLHHVRDLLDAQRGLQEPRKIAVDAHSGRLYVAEGAGSVLVYDII